MNGQNDQDPRFKVANREALIGVGLACFNFIWWYAFAYGLGSQPVANYDFILGMPAWFFYSCLIGSVIMIILVAVMVKLFFKEVPLDDEGDGS
ncbi:YhdT family protein [Salicibibacter cibi]|uniref:YhdT family protein n=1 Tax=Salicibibacter cibi TaxID=2743001 RepID=A0A7T6ZDQ7_9BACI|nr:YhdT family protein [Salicibibacter cibi]QQK81645.1 YhdT family protein [Salicibibacter cibi]